jgi:CHAT domain-containing protein/tetratricopeptide (TPR) repeat protein
MPPAPIRSVMANPVVRSGISLTLALLAIGASAGDRAIRPESSYRDTWSLYVSGNQAAASREALRKAESWRSMPSSPWFWKFRLLAAEIFTAQGKDQEAEALVGDPVSPLPALEQLEVRRLIDRAVVLQSRRPAEALDLLKRARKDVRDTELAIRLQIAAGTVQWYQGKIAAAEAAFQDAADAAARQGFTYWQAQALSNLAFAANKNHHYEQSVNAGLRALDIASSVGARRVAALADVNLGSTYSFLGEFAEAGRHEEQANQILESVGDRTSLMIGLGELGLLYYREGETDKAIPNYRRAYRIAEELGRVSDAERNASNLAFALIEQQQWDQAADWIERASALAARTGNREDLSYLARDRARIAWGRGNVEQATRICRQLLQSGTAPPDVQAEMLWLEARMDWAAHRFPAANQEFAAAIAIVEGTRSELANDSFKTTLLSRRMPFYQDYVDALVEQGDDAGALRVVESSRARVLAERLGRSFRPNQFTLDSLQRLARTGRFQLLSFWTGPRRSYAWFQLPSSAEIRDLVTSYRQVVEHSLTDPLTARDRSGIALWNRLLAQIAPDIPKGARLIVIPDGALHLLNLETVLAPTPKPHYWIDDVELAVAPSIAILAAAPRKPVRSRPSLLLIGAPDYGGTGYTPLPQAAGELQIIAAHFPDARRAVYAGSQASPDAYQEANPSRFSLIHFAAHAEANSEQPLESAIVLARQRGQFKLYARDVINIPIHADLVTVSSCRSAGMQTYGGEGPMGFAWAFLQAGAREVVAGLWDVSDASTEALMDRFYAALGTGQDPARALRNAKLNLLQSQPKYRKPFYWAPFQVYVGSTAL